MISASLQAQSNGVSNLWTEPSESVSQNKLPPLIVLVESIDHSHTILTKIAPQ